MKITKKQLREMIESCDLEPVQTAVKDSGIPDLGLVAEPAAPAIDIGQLLSEYLGCLRGLYIWFHGAHNLTKGAGFSGDHVNLYGMIYDELIENYDEAAEKAIGLTEDEAVACPIRTTAIALSHLKNSYVSPAGMSGSKIAQAALAAIKLHSQLVEELFYLLEASGHLPLGLNDFLASSASKFDNYTYLLLQRTKEV